MRKIIVQSPTRIDLSGGTLDLWPLYNFTGGAKTLNVAINIMTTVEITERSDQKVEIICEDLNYQKTFNDVDQCLRSEDQELNIFKAQFRFWSPQKGFILRTQSESPVGGGLGGSSSLTISLLKAFSKLTEKKIKNIHELVHVAHNIEAEILNAPTGTQDYYPAASGGINVLEYSSTGVTQKILFDPDHQLEKNFILVYTGKAHHSGLNNFEVMTRAVHKDLVTMKALHDLKKISDEIVEAVETKKYDRLPQLFRQEFDSRVKLAKAFSSPEIEKLREVTLQAGAEAVKICGAGGGGCVLVWTKPKDRQNVVDACEKHGFKILPVKAVAVEHVQPL